MDRAPDLAGANAPDPLLGAITDGWRHRVDPASSARPVRPVRPPSGRRRARLPGMGGRPRQADHRQSRARDEPPVGRSRERRRPADGAREKTRARRDPRRSRSRREPIRRRRIRPARGHPRGRRARPRSRARPPMGRLLRPPPQPPHLARLRRRPRGGASRGGGEGRRHRVPRGLLARQGRHPGRAPHRGPQRDTFMDPTVRHDPGEPRSSHRGWGSARADAPCRGEPETREDHLSADGVEKRAVAAVQARRVRRQERGGGGVEYRPNRGGRLRGRGTRRLLPRRRRRRVDERIVPGEGRPRPVAFLSGNGHRKRPDTGVHRPLPQAAHRPEHEHHVRGEPVPGIEGGSGPGEGARRARRGERVDRVRQGKPGRSGESRPDRRSRHRRVPARASAPGPRPAALRRDGRGRGRAGGGEGRGRDPMDPPVGVDECK